MEVSPIRLKVCGMRNMDNILQVSALNPDYMGFIFYEASPRYVGSDFIVPAKLLPSVKRVGVFVNHSLDFVIETMRRNQLHYAQLHGDESVSFCEELKQQGVKVIKVFRVDEDFDFGSTTQYESVSDFFLFDTKGKLYGGNATPFDWDLLNQYNQAVPFFLSGGIQPESIQEIKKLSSLNIHSIDVNSGVEERTGFKNINKISEIINQLHI
jgi:phosphoribosylanthranilate isomerase